MAVEKEKVIEGGEQAKVPPQGAEAGELSEAQVKGIAGGITSLSTGGGSQGVPSQ